MPVTLSIVVCAAPQSDHADRTCPSLCPSRFAASSVPLLKAVTFWEALSGTGAVRS